MNRNSAPAFFVIGAVLTGALFIDVVTGSRTFVGRDVQLVYVPLREFWVAHGPFAGWYPYDGLGQSYLGMLVGGVLHPMQGLNVLLGPVRALEWTTLLCFPFAFTGTALLARRVTDTPWAAELAGAAYAFSGYLVSMTDNPLYLVSAATLPWVAVATDRFIEKPTTVRCLIAGAVTASVLLAGDAMGFGVALAAAGLTGLVRRQTPRGLAVSIVGLALSGPQLLPLLVTGPLTAQAHQTVDAALTWSLHPLRLLEMAIGPVFAFDAGDPRLLNATLHMHEGAESLWARSVFIGAPVLVLAALGLRRPTPSPDLAPAAPAKLRSPKSRQFALGAALLLLLVALGRNTPIAAPIFTLLHGLRYPEKFLPGVVLLIALGAALGVDRFKTASRPVVFCSFALVVLVMFLATPPELHAHVLAWSTASALALGLSFRWPMAAVLPLFAAVHLTTTLEEASVLHSPSPFAKVIGNTARAERWRVATHVSTFALPPSSSVAASFASAAAIGFQPDTAALDGLETSNTYLPGTMADVLTLRDRDRAHYDAVTSTRYTAVHNSELNGREPIASDAASEMALVEVPDALPRVSFSDGVVTVAAWEPAHLAFDVEARSAGTLIVRDARAPGWTARVDGAPVQIEPEQTVLRAVAVPAGKHVVTFDYATPGLWAGWGLCAIALLLARASVRLT